MKLVFTKEEIEEIVKGEYVFKSLEEKEIAFETIRKELKITREELNSAKEKISAMVILADAIKKVLAKEYSAKFPFLFG